jgi:hypothetical protein
MSNLKDTLGTVFGALGGIGIGLVGFATQGFAMPEWLLVAALIMAAVGPVVMGVLIGKNANLTTKTPEQIESQVSK